MGTTSEKRISRNVTIDQSKVDILEELRIINTGTTTTKRHRSDVYNEIIGYGLSMHQLKNELGEKEFNRIWEWINKLDLTKVDITKLI